ncbi:MAG: 3-hydroxyacyl-ACP dehydratase FabZ [Gammaproteobacteria bacterium AqS3]|nr:3-hydroxyacyl-ACP dehydratase FabZ [Gammaproteobacteria bacterium AqS3]
MPLMAQDIREILPHRYPFLLIDRVLELEPYVSARGFKNLTINEEFFQGHFDYRPLMPGVLITEALAQLCGVLGVVSMRTDEKYSRTRPNQLYYTLCGLDKVKFKRPVGPGDRLYLNCRTTTTKGNFWRFDVSAEVDDKTVCTANLLCAAVDEL